MTLTHMTREFNEVLQALPKHHRLRFGTEAYRIAGTIQENADAEGRDLELHQKLFISAVREISHNASFARGDAERNHGRGTEATRAAFDMLERSEGAALQAAYHSYRVVCDRLDDEAEAELESVAQVMTAAE